MLDGIRGTAAGLKSGKIKIHRSCKNTIREFGAYSWDSKKSTDAVIKENDHCMDALRYFAWTVLRKMFDL